MASHHFESLVVLCRGFFVSLNTSRVVDRLMPLQLKNSSLELRPTGILPPVVFVR